jgi:hypothetical protein
MLPEGQHGSVDLLHHRGLAWVARQRALPVAVGLVLLAGLAGLVGAGVWGTGVGNRNAAIVFVWILWWVLLMGAAVPVAARGWCAVCPIPLPGEWLQRRSLLGVRHAAAGAPRGLARIGHNLYRGASRRWPRALSNLWLQSAGFLVLATLSAVLLTDPLATSLAVAGLLLIATAVAVLYRQRSFCRYLCPIGGFLGLYSGSSVLTVRCRDAAACAACGDKACIAGNERAWGCPWLERPNRMDRSNACGFCLECVRACRQENMTVLLRAPMAEQTLAGWDEALKAVLMLGLAIAYTAVYLGPWGALKDAANPVLHRDWGLFLKYAAALWAFVLLAVPGCFLAAAAWGRRREHGGRPTLKAAVLSSSAAAIPLGLAAWLAFSVPLAFVNGSYVLAAASDPLGRGWDVFGTAHVAWTPLKAEWMGVLQALLILGGQAAALRAAWRAALTLHTSAQRAAVTAFLPTAGVASAASLLLLWLHVG